MLCPPDRRRRLEGYAGRSAPQHWGDRCVGPRCLREEQQAMARVRWIRGAIAVLLASLTATALFVALAAGDNVKNNAAANEVGVGGTRTIVLGETTTVSY